MAFTFQTKESTQSCGMTTQGQQTQAAGPARTWVSFHLPKAAGGHEIRGGQALVTALATL